MTKIFCLFCGLLPGSFALAQESAPLITDRPDFTESTATLAPGRTQIESGATLGRSGEERTGSYGEVLIRRGLGKRFEGRLGLSSQQISRSAACRTSGRGDADVGFKIAFSRGSERFDWRRPATSLILASSFPTGSRTSRGASAQPFAKVCLSWPVNDETGLSANFNLARPLGEGGRLTQAGASVSLARSLNERTGVFAEVFAFERDTQEGNGSQFFNSGITYLVNPDLQLDLRVGIGFNASVRGSDGFFGGGVSQRF